MMAFNADTPFVVFGDDWGRYPSTIQHTFRHVAARYPVIWVNGIGHRSPGLNRTDLARAWEKISRVTGARVAAATGGAADLGGGAPAAIIEPRVLPWHQFDLVRRANARWLTRAIRGRIRDLGLVRPPVLVTGSPPSVGVVGKLGEAISVYFVLDDYLNFPTYTASMLAPLERQMLDRVDMVVATAASLTRSKCPRSGRAFHLPQGVNYHHFADRKPEPPDLAVIARPRIGFAGSLSTQCDVSLLTQLAVEFPDASLVFVGLVGMADNDLRTLRRPNVHILGVRSYDVLPAYVQHFDVGIVPYVLSGWTVAVDPLKLLEYLAAGLPVVTTSIPEVAKYRQFVTIAETTDAFIDGVREALTLDRSRAQLQGQAVAREHTWERRADALLTLIESAAQQKRGSASVEPAVATTEWFR